MKAVLVLEDGFNFVGESFGYQGIAGGEVVFNTGMVGYQHVLTDPCYSKQLVVLTYPLSGNYGISNAEVEGSRVFAGGLVVREAAEGPNNWKMEMTLDEYLKREKVVGISQVDTRQLTRRLREKGTMRGIISSCSEDVENPAALVNQITEITPVGWDEIKSAGTKELYRIEGAGPRVVVIDLGIKKSLLNLLQNSGCQLVVVPAAASIAALRELQPAGLFISNGPGDPRSATPVIETVRYFMDKLPVAGVGLGHQLLALALGLEVDKMHFGHHGVNHPVREMGANAVSITSQHHAYVVNGEKLPADIIVTHRHLNDGSVEGLSHKIYNIYSVQYHPRSNAEFKRVFRSFLKNLAQARRS